MLLSENDGFTRFLDPALRHGLVNDRVEAEVAAHLRVEVVVPPIDDVAAVRRIERIVNRVRAVGDGAGNVTRAFQNAIVLVTVAKLGRPAALRSA